MINRIFYAIVLTIAAGGAGQAASEWLGWNIAIAFVAVGAVELGGVALSRHADIRRRLGERAIPARILSALVAVGAVLVNVFGHIGNPGQSAFFGGMSALGYLVWMIDSGARRRDALRASGRIDRVPLSFGLLWLRNPALARRARTIGLDAPEPIGRRVALAMARDEIKSEVRHASIEKALRTKISAAVDPLTAQIATSVYDLEEVADRLAATADYETLTGLISRDLTPERLAPEFATPTRTPRPPTFVQAIDAASAYPTAALAMNAQYGKHPVAEIEALNPDDAPTSPVVDPVMPNRPISIPPTANPARGTKKAAIEAAYADLIERGEPTTTDGIRVWVAENRGLTVSTRTVERVRSMIPAWRER